MKTINWTVELLRGSHCEHRIGSCVGRTFFNAHRDHEPALPRTAAVSETSRSNVRTSTVHGKGSSANPSSTHTHAHHAFIPDAQH